MQAPLVESINQSILVTAQHSEPYRKMGGMQVLYSFNLVDIHGFALKYHHRCAAAAVCFLSEYKMQSAVCQLLVTLYNVLS